MQYSQCNLTIAEWNDSISVSASNAPLDAAQDLICLCCWSSTLLTHTQFVVHRDPQVPFRKGVWGSLVMLSQVQDLAHVFVKILTVFHQKMLGVWYLNILQEHFPLASRQPAYPKDTIPALLMSMLGQADRTLFSRTIYLILLAFPWDHLLQETG